MSCIIDSLRGILRPERVIGFGNPPPPHPDPKVNNIDSVPVVGLNLVGVFDANVFSKQCKVRINDERFQHIQKHLNKSLCKFEAMTNPQKDKCSCLTVPESDWLLMLKEVLLHGCCEGSSGDLDT